MSLSFKACVFCCLFLSFSVSAQTINVGVKSVPPFAMLDEQNNWTGISVDLWRNIAQQMNWQTQWVKYDTPTEQIKGLSAGDIDIAVGAISMTPEREKMIDFSYPFYSTGLAIAATKQSSNWWMMLKQLFSVDFLKTIGVLCLVLMGIGLLFWLAERKHNPQQFGDNIVKGIGNGFWVSAVTMTTVGYGDKAPLTLAGRIVATIWMFASLIAISSFTAAIASSLTMQQMNSKVKGLNDLNHVRTITIRGSSSEQLLRTKGVGVTTVESAKEGLELLKNGSADALVYDESLLRYELNNKPDYLQNIEILDKVIEKQNYAYAITPNFKLREQLNHALLSQTRSQEWNHILNSYLGQQ